MAVHETGKHSRDEAPPLHKQRGETGPGKLKEIDKGSDGAVTDPSATPVQGELPDVERLFHPANTEQSARLLTGLQRRVGNTHVQRLLSSRVVQAKLTVHPPDDEYEKEADRIAEIVTLTPKQQLQRQEIPEEEEEVQTKALPGAALVIQRQDEEEEEEVQTKPATDSVQQQEIPEEEEEVQTKAATGLVPEVPRSLEERINAARGSGEALPDSVRTPFEGHFGRDFSNVRLHHDSESDKLSRELGAKAFTTGTDVFFRSSDYQPHSDEGQRLVGHELTHVVQQSAEPGIQRQSAVNAATAEELNEGSLNQARINALSSLWDMMVVQQIADAYVALSEKPPDTGKAHSSMEMAKTATRTIRDSFKDRPVEHGRLAAFYLLLEAMNYRLATHLDITYPLEDTRRNIFPGADPMRSWLARTAKTVTGQAAVCFSLPLPKEEH